MLIIALKKGSVIFRLVYRGDQGLFIISINFIYPSVCICEPGFGGIDCSVSEEMEYLRHNPPVVENVTLENKTLAEEGEDGETVTVGNVNETISLV